ncbi:hypothetical protein B0T22DRAFT_64399 [Podospora appendiculata]|uniref:Uncharacterized protein n=1 Tax=Podospora appendiculata TaxID=314037 RepID=A0AAE0XIU5_9PEZI|nr:hypothetical protein B0T22DRAFT_64399 [Podospora appendiculata]
MWSVPVECGIAQIPPHHDIVAAFCAFATTRDRRNVPQRSPRHAIDAAMLGLQSLKWHAWLPLVLSPGCALALAAFQKRMDGKKRDNKDKSRTLPIASATGSKTEDLNGNLKSPPRIYDGTVYFSSSLSITLGVCRQGLEAAQLPKHEIKHQPLIHQVVCFGCYVAPPSPPFSPYLISAVDCSQPSVAAGPSSSSW